MRQVALETVISDNGGRAGVSVLAVKRVSPFAPGFFRYAGIDECERPDATSDRRMRDDATRPIDDNKKETKRTSEAKPH